MLHPAVLGLIALTFLTCAFALWKGEQAERLGATIIAANVLAGFAGAHFIPGYIGLGSLILDALTAFSFLALTLRYGKPWLGGAMLIFSLQFALHAFYFVTGRSPHELLNATINNLNFLGVILCLGLGAASSVRSRRKAPPAESA